MSADDHDYAWCDNCGSWAKDPVKDGMNRYCDEECRGEDNAN